MIANVQELSVDYDGKLVPPFGEVGSRPLLLRACFYRSSGVLGSWVAGLHLMWGQVGSWAPTLFMVSFSLFLGLFFS